MAIKFTEFEQSNRVLKTPEGKAYIEENQEEGYNIVRFKIGFWQRLVLLFTGRFYMAQKAPTYVPVNFYFKYPLETQKTTNYEQ